MGRIDIGTVMQKLNNAVQDSGTVLMYGIRFITKEGRVKEIYHCRKNVKQVQHGNTPDPKGRGSYNLKFHGIVRLWDENAEQFLNAKLAHIVQFRDHNSTQWIPIFH